MTASQRRTRISRRYRYKWRQQRLAFERLELRRLLTNFTVTNSGDSGIGSLRQAILDANAAAGPDTILFAIPTDDPGYVDVDSHLASGDPDPDAFVIQPLSELPRLDDPTGGTTLDGRTQTAFSGDTNPFGTEIVIDGSQIVTDPAFGVFLDSDNNQIWGMGIQQFSGDGLVIAGDNNWIAGSYIGTDATGTLPRPNGTTLLRESSGVRISAAAENNLIGSNLDGNDDALERNLISANARHGVQITGSGATGNLIAGNFIGTNVDGTEALANTGSGVFVASANNTIGGTSSAARNILSGNEVSGIQIQGAAATGNLVVGNYIGTNAVGDAAIPNLQNGITINDRASDNQIGAAAASADDRPGNLISGNVGGGVRVIESSGSRILGNLIGLDADGEFVIPNTGDGIDLIAAPSTVIGAATASAIQVISGNLDDGIDISTGSNDTIVLNNFVGLDVTGLNELGNAEDGILIDASSGAMIGDGTSLGRNVISGNPTGLTIQGSDSTNNVVWGNYIGTDPTGTLAKGNNSQRLRQHD